MFGNGHLEEERFLNIATKKKNKAILVECHKLYNGSWSSEDLSSAKR